MVGLSKLTLFMLAARRLPFGPSHVWPGGQGSVLTEIVDTILVLIFEGTTTGWSFVLRLRMLKLKFVAEAVSLYAGRVGNGAGDEGA